METSVDIHAELARRAIGAYALSAPELSYVRHNENLTYLVTDAAGSRYVLRIHLPRYEAFVGAQQDLRAIESELAWLIALRRDTGMLLQEPRPDAQGNLVATVEHPETGAPVNCSMLTWIEATPFTQAGERAPALAYMLGELNARLHAHTRVWDPPAGFTRPAYDAPELQHALTNLERGCDNGVVSAVDCANAFRAGERILAMLRSAERTRDTWGLAHADLPGNLLVRGDALIPIDFSLCGFCYYLFDVGICVSNLKQPLRERYLAGYGLAPSAEQAQQIDAFILMVIMISAGRQVANPAWRDWFQRRFPRIAREYCPMLLRGEPFLLEI
jgi:Ser/Thr protein kinase RdoA (MazF antagonist)